MNIKTVAPIAFASIFVAGSAFASEGKVTINSVTPQDIYSGDKITLDYAATTGPTGDHLHLNVDDKRVEVIRPLKGTTTFGPLAPGMHHVCLLEETKSHRPTGVESCMDINVLK